MTSQPPAGEPRGPGRNLPAAIAVGLLMIVVVVGPMLFWHAGFIAVLVVLAVLCAVELFEALARLDMQVARVPVLVGTVVIIGGSYAAAVLQPLTGIPWHAVLLGSLGVTILIALIWRMPGGADGYVRDAAASLFVISYIPLLASFVGLILAMPDGGLRLATAALCVTASDTGGYLVGATLGRRPMAPQISPKKTWEGLAGSFALAALVGVACAVWLIQAPWWFGLLLGVVVAGFGTAGDLIESLIKRDVGIKDMSSFLPGHGGVLDRMDSHLVAAPAAWVLFAVAGL